MKVLIAEDDSNIRKGLETLLNNEGYQTIACADGQEALDQAQPRRRRDTARYYDAQSRRLRSVPPNTKAGRTRACNVC